MVGSPAYPARTAVNCRLGFLIGDAVRDLAGGARLAARVIITLVVVALCGQAAFAEVVVQPSARSAGVATAVGRTEVERAELASRAAGQFGLADARLVEFDLSRGGAAATLRLPMDDQLYEVELRPHPIRSPQYELIVVSADGQNRVHPPTDLQVVRGRIAAVDGAEFAGLVHNRGVEGLLLMPQGQRIWIEPIHGRVPGAMAGEHVVYEDKDRLEGRAVCGGAIAGPGAAAAQNEPMSTSPQAAGASAGDFDEGPNDIRFAELAIDTDVEFFAAVGSVQGVEAETTNLINIVNLQYERDVRISHVIVRIVVRPQEPDPFGTSQPSNLLDEFRNHWFATQSTVQRDVAHFFTGRSLQDNTAGIAYITGICSDIEGYGLASRPACGSLACKTDLSAHELGHNWGAPHCNCPGYTMNPVVQGGNVFHPQFSVPPIVNYRNTRTCLEIGDDLEGLELAATSLIVAEGNRLPLQALAQFRLHADAEVTADVIWTVDPLEAGFVDETGAFHAADVDEPTPLMISAEYEFDGVVESASLSITVVNASPAPLRDAATPDKNRYLSIAAPAGAGPAAIAVKLMEIYVPDPPHFGGVFVPDLSNYRGQIRWVGPPGTCQESSGTTPPFRCALLQCEPYYGSDWGASVVHVAGGDILPSSEFEIRMYPLECQGNETQCPLTSAPLFMRTQRWGDVVPSFQALGGPAGTATQPDVIDVGTMVDKLKGIAPIILPQAQLSSGAPDPNGAITIIDVAETIDAVKGFAPIFLSPCVCPSLAVCPQIDYCGRCAPQGP